MGEPSANSPRLAVIICHHRGRDLLVRCLASVAASQGVIPEVIVVTSDPTYVNKAVTLLYLEDGPAAKRNLAMRRVSTPYAVFLDDDVEISPDCLYEFHRFLEEHPQCGMAFAKIYKMEEGRRNEFDAAGSWLTWTGFLWDRVGNSHLDRGQFSSSQRCLSSKSATCAVNRTAFTSVAGFDPSYFILGEETDLSWRLWLRGWECWYVPTAKSWHAFGCESLKPKQDYYTIERTMTYGCRNYLSLLWTNLGPTRLLAIFPIHLCAWFLSAVGFLCTGDARRSLAIMRGMQEFIGRLPTLQWKRQCVQSTRTISDSTLWSVIARSPGLMYYWHRMGRYLTSQLHG